MRRRWPPSIRFGEISGRLQETDSGGYNRQNARLRTTRRLSMRCEHGPTPFGLPVAELSWGALRTVVGAATSTESPRIFRGKINYVLARISVHEK